MKIELERVAPMEIEARSFEIIERYDAALRPLEVQTLEHYTEQYQSSGHLYITRIPGITPEQRNEIIIKMAEAGVATNVHYKPLPMHTAYKQMGFVISGFPNAYAQFANEITLPLHTCLTDCQNFHRHKAEMFRFFVHLLILKLICLISFQSCHAL